jgi:nucleoside 2-deoxyribosyltransferase
MMRFGGTKRHDQIISAIRETLSRYEITAHRADDREYHDDLFPNVQTYIYGCSFGIAVFERLESEEFNPNVALEVGYMRALRKPICLLKDRTLATMQTDLVGKLYRSFDALDPKKTIPPELNGWLRDKDIVT